MASTNDSARYNPIPTRDRDSNSAAVVSSPGRDSTGDWGWHDGSPRIPASTSHLGYRLKARALSFFLCSSGTAIAIIELVRK